MKGSSGSIETKAAKGAQEECKIKKKKKMLNWSLPLWTTEMERKKESPLFQEV